MNGFGGLYVNDLFRPVKAYDNYVFYKLQNLRGKKNTDDADLHRLLILPRIGRMRMNPARGEGELLEEELVLLRQFGRIP